MAAPAPAAVMANWWRWNWQPARLFGACRSARWTVEYGEKAKEIGATNIGPSLVTRGGVIFIGAATDDRFHAYDTDTGKLLWQTKMATSSNAGPMTYVGKDGRQYVVIAAGGPGNARRRSASDQFRIPPDACGIRPAKARREGNRHCDALSQARTATGRQHGVGAIGRGLHENPDSEHQATFLFRDSRTMKFLSC